MSFIQKYTKCFYSNDSDRFKKRELNIELLRIILMIFIVFHHLLLDKMKLLTLLNGIDSKYMDLYNVSGIVNSFLYVSVNCFFLISGFFGIKLNFKKIISIFLTTFLYVLIFMILGVIFKVTTFNFDIIKNLLFCTEQYWYIYVYILMVAFSPILNLIVQNTSEKQAKYFTLILLLFFSTWMFIRPYAAFIINNGAHFLFGCYMYLVGAWIKKYNLFSKIKYYFTSYILLSISNAMIFAYKLNVLKDGYNAFFVYSHNNPIVIISSIMFFRAFCNLHIKDSPSTRNIILFFSKSVLGIYILHGIPLLVGSVDKVFNMLFDVQKITALLYSFCLAIVLFTVCLIIDKILKIVFNKPILKISEKISILLKKCYNGLLFLLS